MSKETSAKLNARYISFLLKSHGCSNVVISPGSRNAPLILSLTSDDDYRCISVPDERSAAFVALGMTIENKQAAAVICSSGSAAANFYPAVTEAFYQKLPLLIITADRPQEMIGQGIGQAIRQPDLFSNHIVQSVNLLRDPADEMGRAYNQRLLNEAMQSLRYGPVHINVPFEEPLYEVDRFSDDIKVIRRPQVEPYLTKNSLSELLQIWQSSNKIMLLVGQMSPRAELSDLLEEIYDKSPFLLLHESVSNLTFKKGIPCIDRLISGLDEEKEKALQPDLLISFGGEVVSKRIRSFLTRNKPKYHWHISESGEVKDTFLALSHNLPLNPFNFFKTLNISLQKKNTEYATDWLSYAGKREQKHEEYLNEANYSDLLIFQILLKNLPSDSIIHLANSTAVRYVQLFNPRFDIQQYANRGTSGIDGCTSTAAGHALTTNKPVILITGDIAFLYDSNGLWMDPLPENLRIILINNQGGNIFRIIEGPAKDERMGKYQETTHQLKAKGIAETFQISYLCAEDEKALINLLPDFLQGKGPAILEIISPREESPEILNNYFKNLKDV